ncbi:MAG: glycoside hydrolase family 28 protein [Lachnospiraceae bacterium]|nr:glycoside hydrolase family 28 protein [Lachnospiraceae bacterium]
MKLRNFILGAIALLSITTLNAQAQTDFSGYYKNLPLKLQPVTAPAIPAYTVKISDFGGVNDGVTKNTEAFTKAMTHLAQKGGGHLVVPEGIWYTGPIQFESNVDLHLERGALILFSEDLADYPVQSSNWEGLSTHRAMSPLSARDKENIMISGFGTINGNGQCWRPVKKGKMTDAQWKSLLKDGAVNQRGDIWFPNERIREVYEDKNLQAQAHGGDKAKIEYVHDFLRPVLLSFINCKNVMLKDATFENSPAWNLHPFLCENLIIDNVTVRNPWYAQNGDGIDIESCNNVLVVNSSFDVGDDAICIKSGKDKDGRDRGIPCRNVLIDGCTVYHGHGGFVIGSEMSGGAKDIVVKNCLFIGTDVGLRFKSTRGRGGVVENIYIDDVKMSDIAGDALIFDLYYGGKGNATAVPVTEETPSFKDIYMNNITCRSAKRAAFFNGLPEMPMKNVQIKNSRFRADTGITLNHVDGLLLDNVTIDALNGEPLTKQNGVTNLVIK